MAKQVLEKRRLGTSGEFTNVESYEVVRGKDVLVCNLKEDGVLFVDYAKEGTAALSIWFTDRDYQLMFVVTVVADII